MHKCISYSKNANQYVNSKTDKKIIFNEWLNFIKI